MLHQKRRRRLTLAIRIPPRHLPVESPDTTRRNNLALLFHIPFFVPLIQQLQKCNHAEKHSRRIYRKRPRILIRWLLPQLSLILLQRRLGSDGAGLGPGDAAVGDQHVYVADFALDVGDDGLESGF